jgi:hypothetical protein
VTFRQRGCPRTQSTPCLIERNTPSEPFRARGGATPPAPRSAALHAWRSAVVSPGQAPAARGGRSSSRPEKRSRATRLKGRRERRVPASHSHYVPGPLAPCHNLARGRGRVGGSAAAARFLAVPLQIDTRKHKFACGCTGRISRECPRADPDGGEQQLGGHVPGPVRVRPAADRVPEGKIHRATRSKLCKLAQRSD